MENKKPHKDEALTSKIRLKENERNGDFRPLVVSHLSNSVLKCIVDGFENSKEIDLGYSTITKDKGMTKPTLKKKTIYLTGGSLRDHLKNKTFDTYDCATDASPDEIRLILKSQYCNLVEVQPETDDIQVKNNYKKLPKKDNKAKIFYASRWDANQDEMELTAEINGKKIHIAPFTLNVKNRMLTPKERRFVTTLEQDSMSRDLTINALYLKLKNSDGENAELLDPQGGGYDLKNGRIVTVRKPEKAFENDPYLPFRIVTLASRYGYDNKIPVGIIPFLKDASDERVKREHLKKYFISAVEKSDIPTDIYIQNLLDSNLIHKIFPKLEVSKPVVDLPNSKIITTAFILRNNSPDKVFDVLLSMGWSKLDVENICNLIRIYSFTKAQFNPDLIYDLFAKPNNLTQSQIKSFMKLIDKNELYTKVFTHDFADVMKKYVDHDGQRRVNPEFFKVLHKEPRTDELEDARKKLFAKTVKMLISPQQ
jgi:hypothetical protein